MHVGHERPLGDVSCVEPYDRARITGSKEQAAGVHRMASAAYPVLDDIPPEKFLKLLAAGELATGAILLAPFVPSLAAGAALTGFSSALLGMYARTPALRKPGSIWPSQAGTAVSKDVWMLGIGLGLIGSGPAQSSATLYRLMFGEPIPDQNAQHYSNEDALAKLIVRKIDVAIVVAGQPAKLGVHERRKLLSCRRLRAVVAHEPTSRSVRHYPVKGGICATASHSCC